MTQPVGEPTTGIELDPETFNQLVDIANANNITLSHALERVTYRYLLVRAEEKEPRIQELETRLWHARQDLATEESLHATTQAYFEKKVKKLRKMRAAVEADLEVQQHHNDHLSRALKDRDQEIDRLNNPEKTREQTLFEMDAVDAATHTRLQRSYSDLKHANGYC